MAILPTVDVNSIINIVIIAGIAVLAIAALAVYLYTWWQNKKYGEYTIVIFEKDSQGNTHEVYDKAGVFLNKRTGFKLLFLKKLKKGLNPNNVPYVSGIDKKGRKVKTVYMVRIGVSNYKYCNIHIDGNIKTFTVSEEDVNWAAQDFEQVTKTFTKLGFLEKYGAAMLFAFVVIIILVLLLVLFNKFEVLADIANKLEITANYNRETTELLKNITTTTAGYNRIPTPTIT